MNLTKIDKLQVNAIKRKECTSNEHDMSGTYQSIFFEIDRVRRRVKSKTAEATKLLQVCRKNTSELKELNQRAEVLLSRCAPLHDELEKIIWLENKLFRLGISELVFKEKKTKLIPASNKNVPVKNHSCDFKTGLHFPHI